MVRVSNMERVMDMGRVSIVVGLGAWVGVRLEVRAGLGVGLSVMGKVNVLGYG